MKKLLVLLLAYLLSVGALAQEKLVRYVNPFIGTDGFGNVYPGAQIPFGGIQISPDTDDYDYDVAAGYKYSKPTIMGFSLTHLSGTGIPDLGDFLFVPGTGTVKSATGTDEDPDSGYRSRFSHERESASPGYYSADLLDYGVTAEMTAGRAKSPSPVYVVSTMPGIRSSLPAFWAPSACRDIPFHKTALS